ncbi:hypothetical protein HPB52_012506 [Rhipicephalus sanguineus]|uniref:Sulfotransferase domain-containing protein n=1 Tax=Rhipicephalus sanguineus TaxID=34632 RepID=A0A9D4QA38_RHISA|nr:hypothetical protein HPB52_012506 [Rhipicephalus sanguineus]
MDEESCRFVEGVWMHNFFRDDAIRSAINYKPREGDIIVVTYPKCGTNWMVTYGDYFDHLLPWYERRNDANVLFLTYEELKADTKGQVLKIADFLDGDNRIEMDQESYRFVEGMWMHNFFRDEAIRSAINYKPRDGDVFVVTYPKCGTNWTVFIVNSILTRAKELSDIGEFGLMCPFIEMTGAGAAMNPSRTGPVTTHLPLKVLSLVDKAKYIYVARNPYDCAVSYYHFLKGLTPKTVTDVSFDTFLRLFLSGKTPPDRTAIACRDDSFSSDQARQTGKRFRIRKRRRRYRDA